jgi:transcriptional regulator MraZ
LSFNGTFEHTLDAKNRLTLPAKFRTDLRDGMFLVKGADPCLTVFPTATYQAEVDRSLSRLNPMSREARELSRYFFANADAADLDSAGRITLNAAQLAFAGIDGRQVVLTGAGASFDIWSPSTWTAYSAELNARGREMTEALAHTA